VSQSLTSQLFAATEGFPAVDTIVLGQDVMPGQWVALPTKKEFGWIIQKGWGLSGATVRPGGDELIVAPFAVGFWNAADWVAFQPLRKKYLSKALFSVAGNLTYAIGIVHPELNALGVRSVVPKSVPIFTNNGKGKWIGTVEFLEYRKPRPALEAPAAAIPAAAAPVPSAQDALEAEVAKHAAELAAARGG
jgi:hypothetical protein